MTGMRLLIEQADPPDEGFVVVLHQSGSVRLRSKPFKSRLVAKELVYTTASQMEAAVRAYWDALPNIPDPTEAEKAARRALREMAGMPDNAR